MSNTIIQIKRSSSTTVPANGSLSAAELAYSYNSDKLFIGDSTGTLVKEIGGQYWTNHVINAYNTANNIGGLALFTHANAAFDAANNANLNDLNNIIYANTIGARSNSWANTIGARSNAWSNSINSSIQSSLSTTASSINSYAVMLTTAGNNWTNFLISSANNYAVSSYYTKSGGLISGDVAISGNLTVTGQTVEASVQTLLIGDNLIVLNSNLPNYAIPTQDSGIEVNRGIENNAALFWSESTSAWVFTSNNRAGASTLIASNADIKFASDSANGYALYATAAANNFTSSLITSGNNYTLISSLSANSWANSVAAAANNFTSSLITSGNNFIRVAAAQANTWANGVGAASNNYTNSVNTRIFETFSNASNLISGTILSDRLSGSYNNITGVGTLTSGTWNASIIDVPYGGTGLSSFESNGILYGNSSGSLKVTNAGTEGQVLQASSTGVPLFAMLDGGTF